MAFYSEASNLVPGDTNGYGDIFVRDKVTGTTERVSVSTSGMEGNGESYLSFISVDGRYVAFECDADNLVSGDTNAMTDVFVHDRQTGQTTRISLSTGGGQGNGTSGSPSISVDGRYVAFDSVASDLVPGDTNGWSDVFVHDRGAGGTWNYPTGTTFGSINPYDPPPPDPTKTCHRLKGALHVHWYDDAPPMNSHRQALDVAYDYRVTRGVISSVSQSTTM